MGSLVGGVGHFVKWGIIVSGVVCYLCASEGTWDFFTRESGLKQKRESFVFVNNFWKYIIDWKKVLYNFLIVNYILWFIEDKFDWICKTKSALDSTNIQPGHKGGSFQK